jgi:hypothetical protein
MILACAFVPPEGTAVADTLAGPLGGLTRRGAKRGMPGELFPTVARLVFFNGMSRVQRRFIAGRLCAESAGIPAENVSRRDMPDVVPRTWILTLRDRALSVESQFNSIAAIGGVQRLIPIDTCHDLMVSEPRRLAEILVERCHQYQ